MMTFHLLTAGADRMAVTDPHGWTLTTICILVVFGCLLILYGVYSLLGAILGRQKADAAAEPEENIEEKKDDGISGVITIKTAGWSGNAQNSGATALSADAGAGAETKASAESACKGGTITSPLPGMIIEVAVHAGDNVHRGQKIAVLEAMKMENDILSEVDGTVTAVYVTKGNTLKEGDRIASIE